MKLITLNVEGLRHFDRVYPFIAREEADVLCLQEASYEHIPKLEAHGYTTVFLPRCLKKQEGVQYTDGVIFASKHPFTHEIQYYHQTTEEIPMEVYDEELRRLRHHLGLITANVTIDEQTYTVATTHFTWAPEANKPTPAQKTDQDALLALTAQLPPHILCGDFNIPRHHSDLYNNFLSTYTDVVPAEHKSSMDKTFHRVGDNPEKSMLFSDYMVDYIFTQAPYTATTVQLHFGISDHAAVVSEISLAA